MEIKISKEGLLLINDKRRGCPFDADAGTCGDWCALFGEPEGVEESPARIFLVLCHKELVCLDKKFTDEREEAKDAKNP